MWDKFIGNVQYVSLEEEYLDTAILNSDVASSHCLSPFSSVGLGGWNRPPRLSAAFWRTLNFNPFCFEDPRLRVLQLKLDTSKGK